MDTVLVVVALTLLRVVLPFGGLLLIGTLINHRQMTALR